MPPINSGIAKKSVQPVAGARVLPTIRSVVLDSVLENSHFERREPIEGPIGVTDSSGHETENYHTEANHEPQPGGKLNQSSRSRSNDDFQRCKKRHRRIDVRIDWNVECSRKYPRLPLVSGNAVFETSPDVQEGSRDNHH